ncbi:MAG: cell division protein [Herminiimonas sp.]|nr:cell division protein [Herminiimonas sp.]
MNMQVYKSGRKQAGGTILGLIIGLVIGLGIAVGVALTIKNTQLPFTNKAGKAERQPDVPGGQFSDPNRPLYGNGAASKQAPRDAAPPPIESAKPLPEVPTARKEEPVAPPPNTAADTKASVIEKSAAAKAAAAAAVATGRPDTSDEKFTYYLQAGAFLEQADAENTKAKLALQGVAASIVEKQSDNGKLYRVRIGPFGQLDSMNRVRTKLSDNGVDVAVVKVPK